MGSIGCYRGPGEMTPPLTPPPPSPPPAVAAPCGGAPAPGVTPRCPRAAPPPLPPACGGWSRGGGDDPGDPGDDVRAATPSDVTAEATAPPSATNCSGDTLCHVSEATGDATTGVAPVTDPRGGDKVMAATPGDVTMEGTDQPGATKDPGDTLGHVTEAPGDATTVVAPVTEPQGGDKVMAATPGDVTMEGTDQPSATNCSGDTLCHVNEATRDATTMETLVPTP